MAEAYRKGLVNSSAFIDGQSHIWGEAEGLSVGSRLQSSQIQKFTWGVLSSGFKKQLGLPWWSSG